MKGKISTGIWLIFFGLIALLDNFNIIDFNFYAIIRYWPLLLVSLGISLIFQSKEYGTPIIIGLNTMLCLFLGYVGFTSTENFNITNKISYNVSKDTSGKTQHVMVPFTPEMNEPKLTFNIGASTIKIDNNTSELLEANSESNNLGFQLHQDDNNLELNAIVSNKNTKDQHINISLNPSPIWDFAFNIGAARFTADFSTHQFNILEINAGAAAMNLTLGHPAKEEVKIVINTAASTCKISIPKDAACAIDMTTILSNNKLEGFTKSDDLWKTDNYDTASKKYFIELNGAANSLKIGRY